MDFYTIRNFLENCGLPVELFICCGLIITFTEQTKKLCKNIEFYFETKKAKEIKIFNHTKIVFLIFWSCVADTGLCVANITGWEKFALNLFVMIGLSSTFYEVILKKVSKWKRDV